MTGQPLVDLLECPPEVVRALRLAWELHVQETEARQRQARHGRN